MLPNVIDAAPTSDARPSGAVFAEARRPDGATAALPGPASTQAVVSFPLDAGRTALKLDKPIDLGPAGAVVATPLGVVFRTLTDELWGVPLGAAAERSARKAKRDPAADGGGAERAASRGPAPAFARSSFAYWVSHGRLVRRLFSFASASASGALEVLATDALDGTRVAAETVLPGGSAGRGRDVALYIARAASTKDERRARVWVEGAGATTLSSDGSGASSVALAPIGTGLMAVMLDARTAMSPVHARTIEVGEIGPPRLGADVVVFVGPSPEGRSEVVAVTSHAGPTAFIPFAPDTSSFGLASLVIGREPHLDAPIQWRMYPNGIEPAPVAAAAFCGRTWVAYARPSAAAPTAAQVLMLAPVEQGAFGPEIAVGEGFDFSSVSLAPRDEGGAWLAWVGNGQSFARAVRCG
jgi:hypothetical protein